MPVNSPNRQSVRDAFVTLLETIAGDGNTLQEVINGDPGDQVQGQSPIALVMSAGTRRAPIWRATSQKLNEFRLLLVVLVAKDTPSIDDVLDLIDKEIADLISDVDNRSSADWTFIDFEDTFSEITPANFGGNAYTAEIRSVIVTIRGG